MFSMCPLIVLYLQPNVKKFHYFEQKSGIFTCVLHKKVLKDENL